MPMNSEFDARLAALLELWEGSTEKEFGLSLDQFLRKHCGDATELWPRFRELIEANRNLLPFVPRSMDAGGKSLIDREIGRYRIVETAGQGGMGVVYKAYDSQLKRYAALKFLGERADPRRFESEVQSLAQLEHPNIVRVYDGGTWEAQPYFAMEYIGGGDLRQRISDDPQPPWESARLIMLLARAVQFAHDRGILHRDLKPANVLLGPADITTPHLSTLWGCPKVGDFGLVKRLDQVIDLTSPGASPGTPRYMAPEQIRGATEEVGVATDVYGLGGIFYEMLVGRPAFSETNLFELMDHIQKTQPSPPRQFIPEIPEPLQAICLKCLAKRPTERYPNAKSLADALQVALASDPDAPPPAEDPADQVDLVFDLLGMMKIFGQSLYSEFGAIVRELVQNGHDAIVQEFCDQATRGAKITDYRVDVRYDQFSGMLVIADNGVGMNKTNIGQKLNGFGVSDKSSPQNEALEPRPGERWYIIGQYGVGFLSALALSDKVEIWSHQAGSAPVRWTYKRGWKYARVAEQPEEALAAARQRLNLAPENRSGTIVICYLSPANQQKYKITGESINKSLTRYIRLLRVPIFYMDSQVSRLYSAWDDPCRASDRDWEQMIEKSTERVPQFVIPVCSPPDELDLEGVLWIPPRERVIMGGDGGGGHSVEIFVRRMFVTRDTRIIRPEWAGFLAGMVNSNKISRIVSGNTVIEDEYARQTLRFIKDKIIDAFKALRTLPEADYSRIVGPYDDVIKASTVDHEEFMECVWDKLRVPIRVNEQLTIPEYLAKVEMKSGEKNVIYFIENQDEEFAALTTSDSTGVPVLNLRYNNNDRFVRAVARRRGIALQPLSELSKRMFRPPADEETYRSLIAACASHNIAADIRLFEPAHIPAMLIRDKSLQERRNELLDMIQRAGNQAVAEDLERLFERERAANRGISFYLNAANPLIQDLRSAPLEAQQSVCLALYNISFMSAVPDLKKHEVQLIYNSISSVLVTLVNKYVGGKGTGPIIAPIRAAERPPDRPIQLAILSPRGGRDDPFEVAAREVFESVPYHFRVVSIPCNSNAPAPTATFRELIAQADGFLAEVSDLDPTVMLELGAVSAQSDQRRPVLAFRRMNCTGQLPPELPHDWVIPYGAPKGDLGLIYDSIRASVELDGRPNHPGIVMLLSMNAPKALTRSRLAKVRVIRENEIDPLLKLYPTLDSLLNAELSAIAKATGIHPKDVKYIKDDLTGAD